MVGRRYVPIRVVRHILERIQLLKTEEMPRLAVADSQFTRYRLAFVGLAVLANFCLRINK